MAERVSVANRTGIPDITCTFLVYYYRKIATCTYEHEEQVPQPYLVIFMLQTATYEHEECMLSHTWSYLLLQQPP